MAEKQSTETPPAEPVLLSPRREDVVSGQSVTFEWEAVEDAVSYRLMVAEDSSFNELIVDEEVGANTTHTVSDVFEADGRTYFWHVEAVNEHGESKREVIESFVSSVAEAAAQVEENPEGNDDEDYGPAGELMRASTAEVAAEATGNESYFEEERRRGVAHEGVEAGQIMALAGGILLAIVLMVITLIILVGQTAVEQRERVARSATYPELEETEAEAERLLNQYGMVEGEADRYRIPIDRAMDVVANEAYQDRSQAPSQEPGVNPEN